MFDLIKTALDRINNVQCIENTVHSNVLGFDYAVTVDCVAEIDGELCVIDFKTSSRNEIATELLDTHFAQLAAYSHAYNHMNPTTKINKILIIHVSDQLNVLEKQGDEINYKHDFLQLNLSDL